MFTPRKIKTRNWPVTVIFNDCDENGTVTETKQTFIAKFSAFTEKEFNAVNKAALKKFPLADAPQAHHAHAISEFVVGWNDVNDENKNPIPFSRETLNSMITGEDGHILARAFYQAIAEIRTGVAPAKNVETSPTPGPTPKPGEETETAPGADA